MPEMRTIARSPWFGPNEYYNRAGVRSNRNGTEAQLHITTEITVIGGHLPWVEKSPPQSSLSDSPSWWDGGGMVGSRTDEAPTCRKTSRSALHTRGHSGSSFGSSCDRTTQHAWLSRRGRSQETASQAKRTVNGASQRGALHLPAGSARPSAKQNQRRTADSSVQDPVQAMERSEAMRRQYQHHRQSGASQ
ncbi:hypothetical protein AJ78_08414 [Emergomyces pasteurianus Ep9510]|uniref:Uncharacterized protein n=1 Tax=Emergomyces pasteurianus Ep9510 TaxID=1447872 RepID=A0A1J9P394_9EURO|nr:hypothetical protein AJ78_08414 [Emergomyces pasteurianus Ep9510]